jgi:GMP synthase-like glutamine amidotransferase
MSIITFSLLIAFGSVFAFLIDEDFTKMPAAKCRLFRLIGILLVFFGMCYGMQILIDARIITP